MLYLQTNVLLLDQVPYKIIIRGLSQKISKYQYEILKNPPKNSEAKKSKYKHSMYAIP